LWRGGLRAWRLCRGARLGLVRAIRCASARHGIRSECLRRRGRLCPGGSAQAGDQENQRKVQSSHRSTETCWCQGVTRGGEGCAHKARRATDMLVACLH